MSAAGYLLLEDGARFEGELCAHRGSAVGEVVFTTAMSGYQECFTDPSYAAQLITFTYPHVGNYGTAFDALESARPWPRGAIMRAARNARPEGKGGWLDWLSEHRIPALTGVDTRELVRHIRAQGALRGGIFPATVPAPEARAQIAAEPPMEGRNLVGEVGVKEPTLLRAEQDLRSFLAGQTPLPSAAPRRPLIVVVDTGVKASILRALLRRGASVLLLPASSGPEEVLGHRPDLVLLANGPGDPAALARLCKVVGALLGQVPLFGICLGHQLLCRAAGLQTFKLPFGHRGANHPVKDLRNGRIAITSQNHGFAVALPDGAETLAEDRMVRIETPFGEARICQVNLYDRTVEGVELPQVGAEAVQYHPEAGPGPHDATHLFDRLLARARGGS